MRKTRRRIPWIIGLILILSLSALWAAVPGLIQNPAESLRFAG